jgi:hypothetical protein
LGDPVDDRWEFGCLVIGEYLHPLGCQPLPDRCGGAEAPILPGLAEYLVLHGLRGAERTQDLDEEALFVDGEEIQAGARR